LTCEYKRPTWWANNEQRKAQKERIKDIIKATKTIDKVNQMRPKRVGADTPPGLSHSLPTSATFSGTPHTRAPSIDSQSSPRYHDFGHPPIHDPYEAFGPAPWDTNPYHQHSGPYEVDIKTEGTIYVDNVPTRKDSATSTYFAPPGCPPFSTGDEWIHEGIFETSHNGIFENTDMFAGPENEPEPEFDLFAHEPPPDSQSVSIEVEQCDQYLLDHFIDNVLRLMFPILEAHQQGSARSEFVLPALASNKCYLHCCLSIAAVHLKCTQRREDEEINTAIIAHRVACVSELCTALNSNTDHQQVLEAALGLIIFQCYVGRIGDGLPDIAWHSHFQAAFDMVKKLQLPFAMENVATGKPRPPLNMCITSWIDILGSTMIGRSPQFADTYREKNMQGSNSGLCELMGCEDKVMYMISEIACLDALKVAGTLDDHQICGHIQSLGQHLDTTEPPPYQLDYALSASGAVRPNHLTANITALFRVAARIYLLQLVPGKSRFDASMVQLVARLCGLLEFVPSGPDGFDRSLVWPLLIGGSMSTPQSTFRREFDDRVGLLGEASDFGSFGRMKHLLWEVWHQGDEAERAGERRNVHWRDVMQQMGWDYLLI